MTSVRYANTKVIWNGMDGTVRHHILYLQYLQVFCLVLYGHYHLGHGTFATTMPYVDHKLNAGCKCLEPWQQAIQ